MAILPPAPIEAPFASYNWVDWYEKVRRAINDAATTISWTQITDFTGSNLNQLATRLHSDLQSVLPSGSTSQGHFPNGGSTGQFITKTGAGDYAYAWTTILPVVNGGTGTATPALVAGTNITITGTWPNNTINSTGGGGSGVTEGRLEQALYLFNFV